ncbi:phenylacetate--CoA ligase family protein [Geodermatophilus sabuli]|uniref:Phenylacetate--CoA ligase family protein n=1 Tax=Geodermatophilus sabuli TaxID=1564158 RepID=A0A7K3W0C6_9ACTN|nr:AMP-binding protein [Geodermatophilus sabuli]NEK58326.1 phenylacetate--CoA ligase family protein [Geodermatophilus sabuli]
MGGLSLDVRDGWSRDEVLTLQRRRLRALLAHATASSPYYREVLGPHAPDRPLAELPVLTKATLMAQFDRIVCDPRLHLADLEAHLAGNDPGRPFLGAFRVATTSGTTGRRAIVAFTEREATVWRAVTDRAGLRAGITPGTRVTVIGSPSPAHLTRQVLGSRPGAPVGLTAATPLPRLVAALDEQQPEALICAAGLGSVLADEQVAGRLHITPRIVVFGSEGLSPDLRRRVRAAWGVAAVSMYAATEAPVLASSTPAHPDLEVAEDVVVVEVVDEDDRPVPEGTPGAKVLVTNLVDRAQPLIRYELTDSVTVSPRPNPAGRPWRCLASVDGRTTDILHLPGRDVPMVPVHPSVLGAAVAPFPEVRQYAFVHDGLGLHTRIVVGPGAPADVPDRLRAALGAALAAAGAVPPPVDVVLVPALDPAPGEKFLLVRSA